MLEIIGATLPSAVAIAISPVPIIAVILMLMSERAVALGLAFLAGWVLGILVATGIFTLLGDVLPESGGDDESQPVLAIVQLLLGAGLLVLALRQWRSRPQPGETPTLPPWLSTIDRMRPPAATGLAFALAAVNPKNLLVAAAAGTLIGRGAADPGTAAAAVGVFTLVAALTVLLPVVVVLVAPDPARRALSRIRAWLAANNAVIMTVLLVILGANVIGNGLSAL